MSSTAPSDDQPENQRRRDAAGDPHGGNDLSRAVMPARRIIAASHEPQVLQLPVKNAGEMQNFLLELGWRTDEELIRHLEEVAAGRKTFNKNLLIGSRWAGDALVEESHYLTHGPDYEAVRRDVILGAVVEDEGGEEQFNSARIKGLEDFEVRLRTREGRLQQSFGWYNKLSEDEKEKRAARWEIVSTLVQAAGQAALPVNLTEFMEDDDQLPEGLVRVRFGQALIELRQPVKKAGKDCRKEVELVSVTAGSLANISALSGLPLRPAFFSDLLRCLKLGETPPLDLLRRHQPDLQGKISFPRELELNFHVTNWTSIEDGTLIKIFLEDRDNPYCPLKVELECFKKPDSRPELFAFFNWDRSVPAAEDLPWKKILAAAKSK